MKKFVLHTTEERPGEYTVMTEDFEKGKFVQTDNRFFASDFIPFGFSERFYFKGDSSFQQMTEEINKLIKTTRLHVLVKTVSPCHSVNTQKSLGSFPGVGDSYFEYQLMTYLDRSPTKFG